MREISERHEVRSEPFVFSGYGEIYSYTLLQEPPEESQEQAPYFIALVKLDEGPMILAQLTDVEEEIRIGDRVEMVTRKLITEGERGIIVYGYKFRKVLKRANSA